MEEKLIKGGEVISKASKQEALLRKAESELRERMIQEANLARELAEKEEANLQLEEHFSSLQEEVEVKTKKLKKLWNKYQGAVREAKDLQEEFQTERSDMLDTIRQLTQSLKLKDLIIANFIPDEISKSIEKRASFNPEEDCWSLPKLELSGNALAAKSSLNRPISNPKLRRPETEFARRKVHDGTNNARYKAENVYSMDLDMPDKTTQAFAGPGMKSSVDPILALDINGFEDGDDVSYTTIETNNVPNNTAYMSYQNTDTANPTVGEESKSSRPKTGKKRSDGSSKQSSQANNDSTYYGASANTSSSRPKSAARKSSSENSRQVIEDNFFKSNTTNYRQEEEYPVARGLIRK